jgi:hypothetical protein
MKFLATLAACILPTICIANIPPSDQMAHSLSAKSWYLAQVQNSQKTTIGYVYHTNAYGYNNDHKEVASLKLVCSVIKDTPLNTTPIVAFQTPSILDIQNIDFMVKVDGKKVQLDSPWKREGTLIYREISNSHELLNAMSHGKLVSMETSDIHGNYMVVFDSHDFGNKFIEFEAGCNSK